MITERWSDTELSKQSQKEASPVEGKWQMLLLSAHRISKSWSGFLKCSSAPGPKKCRRWRISAQAACLTLCPWHSPKIGFQSSGSGLRWIHFWEILLGIGSGRWGILGSGGHPRSFQEEGDDGLQPRGRNLGGGAVEGPTLGPHFPCYGLVPEQTPPKNPSVLGLRGGMCDLYWCRHGGPHLHVPTSFF